MFHDLKKMEYSATSDECISDDKLNQLSFLDRFMKETQRLYPSVPIIARHLEEPVVFSAFD
jgi:cytochrome P450